MFACEAKSIVGTIAALNNFGEATGLGFTADRLCRSAYESLMIGSSHLKHVIDPCIRLIVTST